MSYLTEAQAEVLYEAERSGVRQLRNIGEDVAGGYCAANLLQARGQWTMNIAATVGPCPLCGATEYTHGHSPGRKIEQVGNLIIHLNNDHKMTFAEIARKLGPDGA